MTISELFQQYGIGDFIGCFAMGLLILLAVTFVIVFLWLLITLAVSKGLEIEHSIDFDELRYIQNHYHELETKVSEFKSCQLSCCKKSTKDSGRK